MTLNTTRARKQLAKGDLRALFIEELGWDRHTATLPVTVEGTTLELHALAHKRGMLAYQCPTPSGQRLPDYSRRRKIEHQVAKSTHEHLIVFTDETNQTQIWQWVRTLASRPTRPKVLGCGTRWDKAGRMRDNPLWLLWFLRGAAACPPAAAGASPGSARYATSLPPGSTVRPRPAPA